MHRRERTLGRLNSIQWMPDAKDAGDDQADRHEGATEIREDVGGTRCAELPGCQRTRAPDDEREPVGVCLVVEREAQGVQIPRQLAYLIAPASEGF